uniref:Glutathione synthetase n=1 Tax=Globodera rostochiensis TaxID=31243 RepID=A0A914H5E3_GLORO
MSLLYFRISRDFDFLKMAYKDVIQSDRSVRMYMKLLEDIKKEGIKQPLSILTQRSDYMIHVSTDPHTNEPEYQLKQIEVNGGSIGTAGCIERLAKLHRRVLEKSGYSKRAIDNALPENRSGTALALTIFKAWEQLKDPKAIIVFMVVKRNCWFFVHRYDEYELERLSGGRAKIVHLTLAECAKNLTLDDDFTLRLDGRRVGIVYINRVMLGVDYPPKLFAAIRMIERSTAIKATSLFFGMSASKKIQQLLAMPGMVERFFPDPSEAQMVADIRNTFAKMWGLENDDEQTRMVIEDAIAHPERYVLKPNKEGGSENFWGQDIADKLKTFTPSERAAHILMERLNPMITKNYMVFPFKQAKLTEVNNELGIYGYILGNMETGTVLHYEQPGNMVRTKDMQKNEGGVSSGDGVFAKLHYEQPGNMVRTKDMQKNEGGVSSGDGVYDSPFLY